MMLRALHTCSYLIPIVTLWNGNYAIIPVLLVEKAAQRSQVTFTRSHSLLSTMLRAAQGCVLCQSPMAVTTKITASHRHAWPRSARWTSVEGLSLTCIRWEPPGHAFLHLVSQQWCQVRAGIQPGSHVMCWKERCLEWLRTPFSKGLRIWAQWGGDTKTLDYILVDFKAGCWLSNL